MTRCSFRGRARALVGLLLAAIGGLAFTSQAFAIDRTTSLSQLVRESWRTRDGLPEGAILAIHQSTDGFLWLGTHAGLARFDGDRFVSFAETVPGLERASFGRALLEGRHGELWGGLVGGVARFDGSSFTLFDAEQGLAHPFVYALAPAAEDGLWVGTGGAGVWLLRAGRFAKHPAYAADPSLPGNVRGLAVDTRGTLWVATDRGALALGADAHVTRFSESDGLPTLVSNVVLTDRQDDVWIGTRSGLARKAAGAAGFVRVAPFASDDITALFEDRNGTLWVGTRAGALGRINAERGERTDDLHGNERGGIFAIREDDEGALWIGRGDGLECYRGGLFATIGHQEGLPSEKLLNIAERPQGGLWLVDGAGRLLHYEGRTVREVAPAGTLVGDGMLALLPDEAGGLWLGGATLRRWHEGKWESYAHPGGDFNVLDRSGGEMIVAQTAPDGISTLWQFDGGTFTQIPVPVPLVHVQRILTDRHGDLWVSSGAGLLRVGTRGAQVFTSKDGLPSDLVYGITEDDSGAVWVGTRRGLARIRGDRVASLADVAGCPSRVPLHVQIDALGYLWATADDGVYRMALSDLNAAADRRTSSVPARRFTTADGLRSVQVSWRPGGMLRATDGRLWFATERGLSVADPRNVVESSTPRNVIIEDVLIGQRRVDAHRASPVGLAGERLEIRYTAPSLSHPADLRFRYRLLGNDPDWVDAQTRRTAYYTNLSPGSYELRIGARRLRQPWSTHEAVLRIRIDARWYQTMLARVGFVLWAALVLVAGLGLYLRRGRQREVALVRRVSERTEDLHREIAERRHAEEEVRRLNEALEARVQERTEQLEAANLALAEDVEKRRRAERELANEKERLAATLSSIAEGVITTDRAGHIVMMNPVAERHTGWQIEDAKGFALTSVFQIFDRATRTPLGGTTPNGPGTDDALSAGVHRAILSSRSGKEILVDASAAPIKGHDGAVVGRVLVFRDVTQNTRAEEQMYKTQKLEAVGVLAGGIAHDFNNLLTGIFGNIDMARTTLSSDAPAVAWLDEAVAVLEDARGLARQLMTFSAGGKPATEPHALDELLRRSTRFALAGSRVSAELDLPDDLWPCDIDPVQIRQAVDNIMLNARQAMPDGGRVAVRAVNLDLASEGDSVPNRLPAGRYVDIVIADTGPGIPAGIQGKIFDPFFTTKPNGGGLGLAMAHSIVTQHGGSVDLEPAPDGGAVFRLRLPASNASPRQLAAPSTAGPTTLSRSAGTRVLVMDDHPEILRFIRAALERLGCTVDLASDGREALTLFERARTDGRPFALCVLDLTIAGGLGGVETLAAMKALDANVRAIASSGYSNDDIMADPEKFGFVAKLSKPYTMRELATVIEQALLGAYPCASRPATATS